MKKDTLSLVARSDRTAPVELTKAQVNGWVRVAFWGLRVYIVVMIALVAVGFAHGRI
ncbi:MAG: hypothetical protein ACYCVB_00080 [Bacilli bacterium]